jgi:hypothetical protein
MSLLHEIKEAPLSKGGSHTRDTQRVDMKDGEVEDQDEVFKRGDGQVDFRTVSWIRAGVIFLKSKTSVIPKLR